MRLTMSAMGPFSVLRAVQTDFRFCGEADISGRAAQVSFVPKH